MCDQHTHDNLDAMLARRGLTRRQFAAMGATTALAACAPAGKAATASDLNERDVAITTADGTADGFFVTPAKGPSPGVIMWPDIAGLRERLPPYMVPALSSVKVPVTEMIKESINRLIFMLDGGDLKFQQTFPGELIERDSMVPGPHA